MMDPAALIATPLDSFRAALSLLYFGMTISRSLAAVLFAVLPLAAQCNPTLAAASNVAGNITTFATLPNGDLVAGGTFTSIGGVAALGIARRDSSGSWQPLGTGIQGSVRALAVLPNGDLIAGGQFAIAGGLVVNHIAQWDGSTWFGLGSGMGSSIASIQATAVHALLVEPNGDLIVGGHFTTAGGLALGTVTGGSWGTPGHIARWNSSGWSPVGGGLFGSHLNPPPAVDSIVRLPSGDLIVAGQFTIPVGRIGRWDGTAWHGMSSGWPVSGISEPVPSLLVMPNGDLIAGGGKYIFQLGAPYVDPYVARWNGSSWGALGTLDSVGFGLSRTFALLPLPNGELLAGGRGVTANGGATNTLVRWSGSTWSNVASGLAGDVRALRTEPDGSVLVGGSFSASGAVPTTGLARLASPCPATASFGGSGCNGTAGPCTLTATALPWLGSACVTAVGGMPAASIGIVVTSLSPQTIPLSLVLPFAGIGCEGLLQVGLSDVVLPVAGGAAFALPLPAQPAFVGITLYQYAAILEFNASNAIALTATNRLVLSLGAF
jgi:hypothetical protein